MAARELFIGLMSGTSLDGVDAALVEFDAASTRLIATNYSGFSPALRSELLALQAKGNNELHRAATLGNELARQFASAVSALLVQDNLSPAAIRAIGCHGQTIRHRPDAGYTVQIGNAALLAELTGISIVADFRSRDIAADGQGAPLVPAFHAALFGSETEHRVIVNIGGIANLTDLPPHGAITGFDTGPGNLLLDLWTHRHQGTSYDHAGAWAQGGKVLDDVLRLMLAEPYFARRAPKSTGRDGFNAAWLEQFSLGRAAARDVQATLAELTARSIADSIRQHCAEANQVYVCGGGAHNQFVLERVRGNLPGYRVKTTAALGMDPDWVEAAAFAWLAKRTLDGKHGNLPEVTGARGARILGAVYPA